MLYISKLEHLQRTNNKRKRLMLSIVDSICFVVIPMFHALYTFQLGALQCTVYSSERRNGNRIQHRQTLLISEQYPLSLKSEWPMEQLKWE